MITKEHQEIINQAVEYYANNENINFKECAKIFGINRQTLSEAVKKQGYNAKNRRHYEFDEKYFDNINTENKAYWLGFLTADGSVKQTNAISIGLKKEDDNHLKKLKYGLKSAHPIKYETTYSFGKQYESVYLRIGNKHMANTLRKYGFSNKKSNNEIPFDKIDNSLKKDYIRGIVDGDGWLSVYPRNDYNGFHYEIGIGMGKDILEWIKDIIEQFLNIKGEVRPYRNIYRLRYCGTNAKNIITWLYKDASIYLDRKYNIYETAVLRQDCEESQDD